MPEQNKSLIEVGTKFGIDLTEDTTRNLMEGKDLSDPVTSLGIAVTSAFRSGLVGLAVNYVKNGFKNDILSENPQETPYGAKSFSDYFDFINKESPDKEHLEAATAMFFAVNDKSLKVGEQLENYELFKRACRLESGQLVLIGALYKQYKEEEYQDGWVSVNMWKEEVYRNSGISVDLIMAYEQGLVDNSLISPRRQQDSNKIQYSDARLTPLGIKFCEKLEEYKPKIK